MTLDFSRVDLVAVAARVQSGERERAEILRRFPIADWPSLSLERYALGNGRNEDSFSWWLEFGSPELGLITGGSAYKFVIYKKRDGSGYAFPNEYPDVESAWVALRAHYVAVLHAAQRGQWDAIDDLFPHVYARIVLAKLLHVYFPHEIFAVNSGRAILHIAQVLGVTLPMDPWVRRIDANRALLAKARALPEFAGQDSLTIARTLFMAHPLPKLAKRGAPDPEGVDELEGPALDDIVPRYMHISAGEKGRLWAEWQREGVASISWNDLGDLTGVMDDAAFEPVKAAALERNPDWGTGGPRMVWKFHGLRPGDRLLARKGSDTLLGVGRVTGAYFYDPTREHAHRIPVAWDVTRQRTVDYNFGVMSLGEIDRDRFEALTGLDAPALMPPASVTPIRVAEASVAFMQPTASNKSSNTPVVTTAMLPNTSPPPVPAVDIAEPDLLAHVCRYIKARGYHFSEEAVKNYHISLKTRPFVILAGLSGTGKSKLTQLYAEALGGVSDDTYLRLAVQPNWTEVRYLLGYMNGLTNKWHSERMLDFLLSAMRRPHLPHFCCLDEMNLARVEYYFSPMLSAMEEENEAQRVITLYGDNAEEQPVPPKVRLSRNVFFVGTINVDETTQNLSDKVIDRANTIEFYDVDFDLVPPRQAPPPPILVTTEQWMSFCADQPDQSRREQIKAINAILGCMRLSIGYRVLREVELYLANSAGLLDPLTAFDLQVRQRILPRVRGDYTIQQPLDDLLAYCDDHGLERSAAKMRDMVARFAAQQHVSFFR